ncbi:hypothetical protein L218DRAFT_1080639 [Marasmius fiardii PR-910]|nr:hypothetical protein L218DRAFT_1080639 [Marasmius fiardii PR-910]
MFNSHTYTTMKGLNGLPLDDDIIDRILMFSPNFVALKNIILTAKAFHNVYKLHPKSIIRAVAYNVVGPALPQALRAIRYSAPGQNADAEDQPEEALDMETGENGLILPHEIVQLIGNARQFKVLEEFFSLRHKDRRYKAPSQLTFTESWRFQRAIYRIMLYSRVFYGAKYIEMVEDFDEDEDGENHDLVDRLAKERNKRKKLLDAYSDEELLQINSVSRFLKEVFTWAGNQDTFNLGLVGDAALSVGPSIIYDCFISKSSGPVGEAFDYWDFEDDGNNVSPFISGYLSYPITKLFEQRKLKPPPEDSSHWKSILDSIEGEADACARCNVVLEAGVVRGADWFF